MKNVANTNSSNLPVLEAVMFEGEGDSSFSRKIGAAWQTAKGDGFNVRLSALPTSKRFTLTPRREKAESGE